VYLRGRNALGDEIAKRTLDVASSRALDGVGDMRRRPQRAGCHTELPKYRYAAEIVEALR
jgi:hypothetical protein